MAQVTSEQIAAAVAGHTVATRFRDMVAARPDQVALRWKTEHGWATWTWVEYADRACRVAGALRELGVGRGERVVLMLRNRPEFHVADVATLLLGATPVSIYNSSAPEQVRFLAQHCGAVAGVVEDLDYLERMLTVRDELPLLQHLAVVDHDGRAPGSVVPFDELCRADPVDLDQAATTAAGDDLATIIYTSGTTGPPKGVMLDHANVVWTVESLRRTLEPVDPSGWRLVSYLPMAHVAERMNSHYQAITFGYEVSTCPEPGRVAEYLPATQPQLLFAVPRIWEKMHAGVLAVSGRDPQQAAALEAALAVGDQEQAYRARGETLPAGLAAEYEMHRPTLTLVRQLLGLDEVVSAVSGAAPVTREVLGFFRALGVELSEIYGLSESSGPLTWAPWRVRVGTVGPAIPGCSVRLGEDGEVLARGGNIFRGYLNDPSRTAEALDADGWLHSGDVGEFDEDGYLRIVDRKKELIITAGGKNISPANLEAALKAAPIIGQACVIGDGRPFVSALVVLDPEVAPAWAATHGVSSGSLTELAANPTVEAEVAREVGAANDRFSSVEQIKQFSVLGDEWLPDSEELTPTMKLKRRGIYAKYADAIDAMYRRPADRGSG
jgi:long-chain acyl-CoA synthetase